MSKRKEKKPAPLADWELVIDRGESFPARVETLEQTRWKRGSGGYYTFRDREGIVAEFAPGLVWSVRRLPAAAADPHARALAAEVPRTELAAKRQNGERG